MRKLQMAPIPCGRRGTHEGRAPQRREGVEGRQEPLVSGHQPRQRRIGEVPGHRGRHPPGGEHAGPRAPHRRVDVLHPRGPRRGDVGAGTQGPGARYRDLLPRRFDPRNPKRGQGSPPVSVVSCASLRDRRPVSELAGSRKPRDDGRLTAPASIGRFSTNAWMGQVLYASLGCAVHAHHPGRSRSPCRLGGRGVGPPGRGVHPRLVHVERPDVDLDRRGDGPRGPRHSRGRHPVSPHREARLIGHCETRSVIESYPDDPFGNGGAGVESWITPAASYARATIRNEPPCGGGQLNVHNTQVRPRPGRGYSVASIHVEPPSVLTSTREIPRSPANATPPISTFPPTTALSAGTAIIATVLTRPCASSEFVQPFCCQ